MDGAPERTTPFWEQYRRLKAQHPTALLWTRLGDFYEMFEDDARIAARELHITLTSREFGKDFRVPLAGVPYHAADGYLARLIRKGYHVAICEQMSEPGHGLVERQVVRVVTPGTLAEPGLLPERSNTYLAAVLWSGDAGGLAYVDVSTGEFCLTEADGDDAASVLDTELRRLAPAEVLTPNDQAEPFGLPGHRTVRDRWHFDEGAAREQLMLHFHTRSLGAFGCESHPLATACAGAILAYVGQTNPALLPLLSSLRAYSVASFMQLDRQTRHDLNLMRGARGDREGSLLATLDCTQTAGGARLLRRWLGQPLLDIAAIEERQATVAALREHPAVRTELRRLLGHVLDLERITGRIRSGGATPREVWGLGRSLRVAREMQRLNAPVSTLRQRLTVLDECDDVASAIEQALSEPGGARTIAEGYSGELDDLRRVSATDRAWMENLEAEERRRTGIKSLKVAFNKVFGYYIEVTNPNLALVPADYLRKQTVAGAERYVTPALKEVEARLARADEEAAGLEARLFAELLRRLGEQGERLRQQAQRLAEVDVYCALAEVAERNHWTRPTVTADIGLAVVNGRHPMVEAAIGAEQFIPNDCHLGAPGPTMLLITGPNMAGKSTYLRQVALMALLAQIGSCVPAESAQVGLVDRIFTRVGAQDDLAGGASTFMVEMTETATICRQATPRSLIILDEVGRGTSSEDGAALAQAVLEYLHDGVGARTLFATHFRELGYTMERLPRLAAATFAVLEISGQLAFTHRITPGVADRSYGLHVARLAGLPGEIVHRAQALLDGEREPGPRDQERAAPGAAVTGGSDGGRRDLSTVAEAPVAADSPAVQRPGQVGTRERAPEPALPGSLAEVLRELEELDLVHTTPLQALVTLAEVQQSVRRLLGR